MQAHVPRDDEEPMPPAAAEPTPWDRAQRAVGAAEQHVLAGSRMPPMHSLSALARAIVRPFVKAFLRLSQLFMREQQSFNVETVRALQAVTDATRGQLDALEKHVHAIHEHLAGTIQSDVERDRMLTDLFHQLDAHRVALDAHRAALDAATSAAAVRANDFEHALWTWRQESAAAFEEEARRAAEERARLRTQLLTHERQLGVLDDARAAAAAPPSAGDGTAPLPVRLDAFYQAFEDRFRGPRDEIRTRVGVYLPIVREAGAGTPERPIVDLGCGRGEWLELLSAEGLTARGADANVAAVEDGRARGLDVAEADAIAHLRSLPDASCGAVTAFHLVEHLPFAAIVALVDEIVRVLRPGGVMVLETPNPTNLLVGAASFYIDPTHGRPLHPETMRFLAAARGLERVDVRFLHPAEGALPDDGSPVVGRLNALLYGPQDFAVVAYRP
jgi:SAM-dependent methyltransferase